ncbi:MAG: hypothetical protein ACW9W4_06510 [Candidatus Nitrosopumilus sp. bin_7KS]
MIVEGLGGKIWVESEENVQTTFFFKIPKKTVNISGDSVSVRKQEIDI